VPTGRLFELPGILVKEEHVLGICRQNLVSVPAVKASDLHRWYTKEKPSRSPEANSFVTSRFVYADSVE
jgi:hypothetical protein